MADGKGLFEAMAAVGAAVVAITAPAAAAQPAVGSGGATSSKYDLDAQRVCGGIGAYAVPDDVRSGLLTEQDEAWRQSRACDTANANYVSALAQIGYDRSAIDKARAAIANERAKLGRLRGMSRRLQSEERSASRRIRSMERALQSDEQSAKSKKASVVECYAGLASAPLKSPLFSPKDACAAYSGFIQTTNHRIKSMERALGGAMFHGRLIMRKERMEVAAVRGGLRLCLTAAGSAGSRMVAERNAAAGSESLSAIAQVSPDARTAGERARVNRERTACIQQVNARRAQRIKSAQTRPIAELRAIPKEFRLPQEQQRVAAADAVKAAAIRRRSRSGKWMSPLLSAAICMAHSEKRDDVREIRSELSYARKYGGVVDKEKLYDLQQDIRRLDGIVAESRHKLRRLKGRRLGCRSKAVRLVTTCLLVDDAASRTKKGCDTERMKEYDEIADTVPGWGSL